MVTPGLEVVAGISLVRVLQVLSDASGRTLKFYASKH